MNAAPAAPAAPAAHARPGAPPAGIQPIRPRILVLLGDSTGAHTLKRRLERGGFVVDAVRSPHAALALAALNAPDLVMLDVGVPYAGGDELLRRLLPRAPTVELPLRHYRDLYLDAEQRRARLRGKAIDLTSTECDLLQLFMAWPERVLSRSELMARLWPRGAPAHDNILEFFVSQLRHKLEAAGEPRLIHTVRGAGYVLREE